MPGHRWWGLGVLLVGAAAGCGGEHRHGHAMDGGADGAVPACDAGLNFATGDDDGAPSPLTAPEGQARAGRLTAEDIPTDPEGLALWRAGDFVVANARVALAIEDVGDSDLYDPWGGKPIGMAQVADGKLVRPAKYNEVLLGIERFTVATTSVTVLSDGTDGKDAVVRAVGPLRPIPFMDAIGKSFGLAADYSDVMAAIDYVLPPDSSTVTVRVSLLQQRDADIRVRIPMNIFMQKSRMPVASPVYGFDSDGALTANESTPYVAFVDDEDTGYIWESGAGAMKPFLDVSGTNLFSMGAFAVPRCEPTSVDWAHITMGGPGLDGLLQVRRAERGEDARVITGTVTEADGTTPAASVHVHVTDDAGAYLTRATTDGTGAFVVHLPKDTTTGSLTAYREGESPASEAFDAADDAVALQFGAVGWVHVLATETRGEDSVPTPAKVQLFADTARASPRFGEGLIEAGRSRVVYSNTGDVTLRAPVGTVRVVVSRGPAFDVFDSDVSVAAGETTEVPAAVVRAVDTDGYLCADFHIHTNRSTDAPDSIPTKLGAAVADGLDIAVRSDHEWIGDFEPSIADLGLGAWVYGVASEELTTFEWGHMGVLPLLPDDALPNQGAVPWAGRAPLDVIADARGRSSGPLVIMNHPRDASRFQAYFSYVGYDPVTDTVSDMADWDPNLQVMEAFNGSSFDANYCEEGEDCDADKSNAVNDWFALQGSALVADGKVFAVGSSDSHSIRTLPVGYPRTCLRTGADTAEALRGLGPNAVRDALAAGHAVVSGGVFVTAVARGDAGPGDTVTGASAQELVHVRVQAPPWVEVNRLRVFVDGQATMDMAVPAPVGDDVVRFDDDVAVNVAAGAKGSWVVVVATGDAPLAPLYAGTARTPFGVTNPIYFRR